MTPVILLALLSSPLSQPKIPTDNKMELFRSNWLLCFNWLIEDNCKGYHLPEKIIDTEKFWKKQWDLCVDAAIKCELEKAGG